MAEAMAFVAFEHTPLPDPQTHIRLLKVINGHIGQPAKCELTTWPLESLPPYYAISYTWGEPSDTTNIEINDKRMVVRRNCEYVLQQAFAEDAAAYLWVDAICIDQENLQEKSYQVAMMGDMYQRAARVLACIGPHADDSDFLMGILASRKAFLSELKISTRRVKRVEGDWSETLPYLPKPFFSHPGEIRAALLGSRSRIARAFLGLLGRPYFCRVWMYVLSSDLGRKQNIY